MAVQAEFMTTTESNHFTVRVYRCNLPAMNPVERQDDMEYLIGQTDLLVFTNKDGRYQTNNCLINPWSPNGESAEYGLDVYLWQGTTSAPTDYADPTWLKASESNWFSQTASAQNNHRLIIDPTALTALGDTALGTWQGRRKQGNNYEPFELEICRLDLSVADVTLHDLD